MSKYLEEFHHTYNAHFYQERLGAISRHLDKENAIIKENANKKENAGNVELNK